MHAPYMLIYETQSVIRNKVNDKGGGICIESGSVNTFVLSYNTIKSSWAKYNGGFIYDINTGSLVECQNLFQWYESTMDGVDSDDNDNPNMGQPMLPSGDGESGVVIPVNTQPVIGR